MESKSVIEFYSQSSMLTSVESSMVPPVGSYISIRKKVWRIGKVTFAVDYSDENVLRIMRCNVDLDEI